MSDIEKVKEKNSENSLKTELTWDDYKKFYSNVFSSIISLLFSAILASILLYICKIAQSNILIDSTKYEPFGNTEGFFKKTIKDHIVDINITKVYSSGFFGKYGLGWLLDQPFTEYSTKLTLKDNPNFFKFLKDLKKRVIGKTDDIKGPLTDTTGWTSFYLLYFYNVLSSSITTNFWVYNNFFGFINKAPESLIILLFMYLGSSILIFLFIISCIIVLVYCILHIFDFFRNRFVDESGEVFWCLQTNNYFRFYRWFCLLPLFLLGSFITMPTALFVYIYSFFISLYVT